jgi:hypothetical protein
MLDPLKYWNYTGILDVNVLLLQIPFVVSVESHSLLLAIEQKSKDYSMPEEFMHLSRR